MRAGAWTRATRGALIAALGLLLALVIIAPLDRASSPRALATEGPVGRCADLVVLGARASGQRLTADNSQMGTEVHAMASEAASRLDVSSVRLAGLPYPAVPTSHGTAAYEASVREGVALLGARLTRLFAACPRTQVALAGFSQGAEVVHRALTGPTFTDAQQRRVVAVALIADPTYDAGTTNAHQVRYGVDAEARSGLLGPGEPLPAALAARTIDFCHPDDLVCSFGGPDGEIWMASWAGRPHGAFYEQPDTVTVNGAHFARVMRDGGAV
jgi:cutinase